MAWARRLWSRWKYPEQRAWLVVGAWAIVVLVIIVAASTSFTEVIFARASARLVPDESVSFRGVDAAGVLLPNGTATLELSLTVTNPSRRTLALASITYESWIEDLPAEAGIPNLGRTDAPHTNATGTYLFFAAFLGSFELPSPVPIPAQGTGTARFSFNLTSIDAPRFNAVQNISLFASHAGRRVEQVPWVHWVQVVLSFPDMPAPSATSGGYVVDLARIILEGGLKLG